MNGISRILGSYPIEPIKTQQRISKTQSFCGDVFTNNNSIKELGKKFRKEILDPLADKESELYQDKINGGKMLKSTLTPYNQRIQTFSREDAERFTKLVFGTNQIKLIDEEAKTSPELKVFRANLEKRLGQNIAIAIL